VGVPVRVERRDAPAMRLDLVCDARGAVTFGR